MRTKDLTSRFADAMDHFGLPQTTLILVAVSGGSDSTALLGLMREWVEARGRRLYAAHFNHKLRPEAEFEESAIGDLCREWGVPLEVGVGRVAEYAHESKLSIHHAARRLRHHFLAAVARDLGEAVIAVAHQSDDVVETLLMRLIDGSGVEGLAGMSASGPSPADLNIRIIRPLIAFRRTELQKWCVSRGIPFCVDVTNEDRRYPRSRIRRELVPPIEQQFGRAGIDGILRSHSLLGEASELIGEVIRRAATESTISVSEGEIILDYSCFSAYNTLIRTALVQRAARLAADADVRISLNRCRAVERLAAVSGRVIELGEGIAARRWGGRLYVFRVLPQWDSVPLTPDGGVDIPGVGIIKATVTNASAAVFPPPSGMLWLSEAIFSAPVTVRPARPGDRLIPFGSQHSADLRDLLRDAGVPPHRRRRPVLESSGQIIAVPPWRIAESAKINPGDTKAILLTVEAAAHARILECTQFYGRPEPIRP